MDRSAQRHRGRRTERLGAFSRPHDQIRARPQGDRSSRRPWRLRECDARRETARGNVEGLSAGTGEPRPPGIEPGFACSTPGSGMGQCGSSRRPAPGHSLSRPCERASGLHLSGGKVCADLPEQTGVVVRQDDSKAAARAYPGTRNRLSGLQAVGLCLDQELSRLVETRVPACSFQSTP